MKIRTFLAALILAVTTMVSLNSCTTKQSAINQMEALTYDIRDNGSYYTIKDWKEAAEKFVDIRKKNKKRKDDDTSVKVKGASPGFDLKI